MLAFSFLSATPLLCHLTSDAWLNSLGPYIRSLHMCCVSKTHKSKQNVQRKTFVWEHQNILACTLDSSDQKFKNESPCLTWFQGVQHAKSKGVKSIYFPFFFSFIRMSELIPFFFSGTMGGYFFKNTFWIFLMVQITIHCKQYMPCYIIHLLKIIGNNIKTL